MEAPKEIYLFQSKNDGSVGAAHHKQPVETEKTTSIKYIRADLAELTWEDIESIFRIADNYDSEFDRNMYLSKGYCKEVLRRFNESRK